MGSRAIKYKHILVMGLLVLITLGGSFLRLYKLAVAPPSVNWDEASYGYNAWSLWKTGRDEYGTALPLTIRSFDDFKPPIYAYASAPIVGIFGLNEFNTRLVSAVSGILTILVTFALASRLFKSTTTGLVAAFVVAGSPWSAHYSRLAFEAVPALLLLLISWWYLQKAEKDLNKYSWAMLFATLAYFAYNSHKIYWLLVAGWIAWKLRRKIFSQMGLVLKLGLITIPILISVISGQTLARFSSTSIFPLFFETRSPYLFASEFVNRYVAYFSPVNVFVRGTNEPNQKVANLAVFYPFEALFFGIGAWWLFKHWKTQWFIIFWWLTAPIPAALTWSWFTPIRVLPLWWMSSLVIALGFIVGLSLIAKNWKKSIALAVVGGWALVSIWWYLIAEVWTMPYTDYGQWQWGFRETIKEIEPYLDNYDYVVWETSQAQPHIFTLFYSRFSPSTYQEFVRRKPIPVPRKNFDIPGYEFRKIFWPTDGQKKKVLFIGSVYSLPESDIKRDGVKFVKDIIDPGGYIIYRISGF